MSFHFLKGVPNFPVSVAATPNEAAQVSPSPSSADPHPLTAMPREDLDLIVQLVLHSGSLKDLATAYDVSYPTIRNRLDRVIERLRAIVTGRKPDGVGELLDQMVERGEIAPAAARNIRDAVRRQLNEQSAPVANPNGSNHA